MPALMPISWAVRCVICFVSRSFADDLASYLRRYQKSQNSPSSHNSETMNNNEKKLKKKEADVL